jgi:hypothetical protein
MSRRMAVVSVAADMRKRVSGAEGPRAPLRPWFAALGSSVGDGLQLHSLVCNAG